MCETPGEIFIAASCHKAHRSNTATQVEPFKEIHLEAAIVLPVINGAAGRTSTGQRDSSDQLKTIKRLSKQSNALFFFNLLSLTRQWSLYRSMG